jgi:hypothetical protein
MRRRLVALIGPAVSLALAAVAACDASSMAAAPDASADEAASPDDAATSAHATSDASPTPADASDSGADAPPPDCPVAFDDPRWDGGAFDAAACGVTVNGCQAEIPAPFACRLLEHAGPNGGSTYPCVVCPRPLPCGPAPYCTIVVPPATCDPDAGTYTMRCGSGA